MQHIVDRYGQTLRDAAVGGSPICIRGAGTKDFYGCAPRGEVLDARPYAGIVDYEPTELVITARAGTSIADIEAALSERGQMLAFEPPQFGASTLGGCIATGLSGPRRPYSGSARDVVLGVRILDGRGTDLRFGGQVIKNVAGYDVSRLMVGSLGTLALLLEVSLKVLPRPPAELTLKREHAASDAIRIMNEWAGKALPISATCHVDGTLYVRLSGALSAVSAARAKLGGDELPDGPLFWRNVRDQTLPFFQTEPLWRVSLKSSTQHLELGGRQMIEWSGALRWLAGNIDAQALRDAAARAGGHTTLFRGGERRDGVFQPLAPALMKLHRRLKETFDPHGILNVGRMYPEF